MPNEYSNGAVKAKDKDNNYVRFRGGSDKDWEKIRRGLEQIGYLTEAVEHLKEYALAGGSIGGGGGGGGGSADVGDASNTRKGITYLTDDPNANKNAATGVTAMTPKGLQVAIADLQVDIKQQIDDAIEDLKNQIENGEITGPDTDPEPEPEPEPSEILPTLTVEGYPDNVPLIPTCTIKRPSSAPVVDFKRVSWGIYTSADAFVWSTTTTTETVIPPRFKLKAETSYILKGTYEWAAGGVSKTAELTFTTGAFYIDQPTMTVEGAPNNIPEAPTLTLSPFSGTDTYQETWWFILPAGTGGEAVWEAHEQGASVKVPLGKLIQGKRYLFGASYLGKKGAISIGLANANSSEDDRFLEYYIKQDSNNIGKPGDLGFGVGVAPNDVYESLGLKPLPGTKDPESFQYGLYEATAPDDSDDTHIQTYHAYLKYIPKCYHCFLSTDDETLMNDGQLQELEQYTGLTVAQMKEAQRRGGTAAIALAPASAFENEADANAHGFILNRGYYDDGKEKPGFFIANTLTSYFMSSDAAGNTEIQYYCGAPSFQFEPTYKYSDTQEQTLFKCSNGAPPKLFGISANVQGAIDLARKFTGLNCISLGMWQVICMLCFAAGLYAKDNTECAWYSVTRLAAPNGINTTGTTDDRDKTVTTSPAVGDASGTVWVNEPSYPKTTHNGRINGITNCNGWATEPVLGANGNWRMAPLSMKLADVVNGFDELTEESFDYSGGISVTEGKIEGHWGGGWPSIGRSSSHDAIWASAFAFPQGASSASGGATMFGNDSYVRTSYSSNIYVGGQWLAGRNSGIFCRMAGYSNGWEASGMPSCRIGGYPEV